MYVVLFATKDRGQTAGRIHTGAAPVVAREGNVLQTAAVSVPQQEEREEGVMVRSAMVNIDWTGVVFRPWRTGQYGNRSPAGQGMRTAWLRMSTLRHSMLRRGEPEQM